jgi:hypothetical protein
MDINRSLITGSVRHMSIKVCVYDGQHWIVSFIHKYFNWCGSRFLFDADADPGYQMMRIRIHNTEHLKHLTVNRTLANASKTK